MFDGIRQRVIWKYDAAVPEEKLRRHYRIARGVVNAEMAIAVICVSAFAEVALCEAVLHRDCSPIVLAVLTIASVLATALMLPTVIAIFWAVEIEKVLAERGLADAHPQSIETRIGIAAMKVVLYAAILVIGFRLLSA